MDRVVRRFYRRGEILRDSSEKGVEILRVLALSIRPEQDYDEEFRRATQDITVGALKRSASNNDVFDAIHSYRPPYSKQSGFEQLGLREALNKIAHADPSQTGFFANDVFQDLVLSGKDNRGKTWIAIITLFHHSRQRIMGLKLSNPESAYDTATSSGSDREIRG